MMNAGDMLVAAPGRWDEACFAVPAVRALIASGLRVGVLCEQTQREFWETVAGLSVIDFPAQAKAKAVAAQIAGSWQASLAWEVGVAAEAFQIAAIPRRLGADERKLKKRLTHPLNVSASPLEHRVRHYLAAIEELDIQTGRAEFFAPVALGVEPIAGAVLLCPDSDFGASHEWPIERWEEIAGRLADQGRRVVIADLQVGRGSGKVLAGKLGDAAELLPLPLLDQALPLLAGYRLIVAADGSLPHLAAHVGATCVTLFGPNDWVWKRPLGKRHAVVKRHVECAPCLLPKCPLDMRCQNELETERVWQVVQEKLTAG
jgi:ADP-heptose:LPS heptosyltransferase